VEVRVLLVDDDEASRRAIVSVLKTEGWVIEPVGDAHTALEKLREGPWHLAIASLSVAPFDSPLFESLQALDEAEAPLRVLFLVPVMSPPEVDARLERLGLPHTNKPVRMDDLLEQISDLLMRAGAIHHKLRLVRELAAAPPRHIEADRAAEPRGGMFAARKAYEAYTEEELKAFEEEEEKKRKAGEPGDKPRE
jgi:DNA-binding NtrC family response regulator